MGSNPTLSARIISHFRQLFASMFVVSCPQSDCYKKLKLFAASVETKDASRITSDLRTATPKSTPLEMAELISLSDGGLVGNERFVNLLERL